MLYFFLHRDCVTADKVEEEITEPVLLRLPVTKDVHVNTDVHLQKSFVQNDQTSLWKSCFKNWLAVNS